MSDSLRPHGLQPTRLLCPWNFPGKNTGVGCHFLFQGILLTQGSNPHFLYWQAGSLPLNLKLRHPPCPLRTPPHRQVSAIVGAAAVLDRNADTLGQQEAVVTLTALKAAGGAACEARKSRAGALAGARADGVVAVGWALQRCRERSGVGSRPCPLGLMSVGQTVVAQCDQGKYRQKVRARMGAVRTQEKHPE